MTLKSCCALIAMALPLGAQDVGAWKMVHLDLEVTPRPEEGTITVGGTVRLRLEAETSKAPTLAINGRRKTLEFVSVDAPGSSEVDLNVVFALKPKVTLAVAHYDEPFRRGAELELSFVCESEGVNNQFQIAEDIALASWVETWYPIAPDPGLSLSQMASAPGMTRFHLPPGWDAVSNGLKRGREEKEHGVVVTWDVGQPVARSFAAGPYTAAHHRVGDRDIGVYLLGERAVGARTQAQTLAAALAAQEERFGPYPYPSYAIAEVPEGRGSFYASSEQGFIMAKSSAFDWDHGNLPLWAHEMAHGWWGNLIGGRGDGSILCNESLAQYSAVIAIEAIEGREAATEFLRFSRSGYSPLQCARGYFGLWRAGTDKPLSELGSGGWQHTLSDAKGHWIYHMLRRRVGDEIFFEGMRGLIEEHGHGRMSLDDVRARFETLAPEAELRAFFEQWLDRTGAPVLDVEWSPIGERRVEAVITQRQEGRPYHLVLDLAVDGDGAPIEATVVLRERETRVELEAPASPTGIRLDPEHELLIWTPEYGARP